MTLHILTKVRYYKPSARSPTVTMAIYHCHVTTASRSSGGSACAGAAYRAGEKIHDERADKTHDYSRKSDVGHSALIGWDGTRSELWNCAELTDTRKNATTAREYEVAIPRELSTQDRIQLAENYASWIFERHGVAADLNIHDLKGDKPHAHILTTTRKTLGSSLGDKVTREWSDTRRKKHGLPGRREDLIEVREKWSELANQFLADDNKIDHRSYKDQGIDAVPQLKKGKPTHHLYKRTGIKNERYERFEDSLKPPTPELVEVGRIEEVGFVKAYDVASSLRRSFVKKGIKESEHSIEIVHLPHKAFMVDIVVKVARKWVEFARAITNKLNGRFVAERKASQAQKAEQLRREGQLEAEQKQREAEERLRRDEWLEAERLKALEAQKKDAENEPPIEVKGREVDSQERRDVKAKKPEPAKPTRRRGR